MPEPPGPGDAEDRGGPAPSPAAGPASFGGIDEPALDARDGAREGPEVPGAKVVPGDAERTRVERPPRPLEHVVHHPLEAHPLAVLRGVDAGDAVLVQRAHLLRHDDPAAAAEDPHVPRPALAEHVQHVPEVLDVPALVGADRDRVHVLVDGGGHHLLDGAVVAEVDHLAPRPLEEAPHDVDRRVVAVEEARGGDETKGERGLVRRVGGFFGGPESEGWLGHDSRVRIRSGKSPRATKRYATRRTTSIFEVSSQVRACPNETFRVSIGPSDRRVRIDAWGPARSKSTRQAVGHVFAELELSNPRRQDLAPLAAKALADTGELMLCIPEHVAIQLDLEAESMREVSVADGRSTRVPYVGPIKVAFGKRFCYVGALVLGDEVRLGVVPMEDMDLVVDPARRKLTVDPASPNLPHARVK